MRVTKKVGWSIIKCTYIDNNVEFFGFKENRLDFLKGFDVFVLPSRLEGIPRCLMEAMAAGVVVVATDIPGCTDLVKHEHNGLLFKPDDVESLLANIEKYFVNNFHHKIGQNGRDFVVENYSAAKMAKKYEKLYEKLMVNGLLK